MQYYRYAKGAVREERAAQAKADQARERFEHRLARQEREQAEKEAKRKAHILQGYLIALDHLDAVIKFSDAMILALVFPNMIGLLLLFPKVQKELKRYVSAIKEAQLS